MAGTPSDSNPVSVVAFESAHVASVADAHTVCFPGFFLTHLGPGFLRLYYTTYLEVGGGFGAVAVDQAGTVRAFAVGVENLDHLDAVLFRRHPWRVMGSVARAWFSEPSVRAQVRERLGRVGQVISRVIRHDAGAPGAIPAEAPFAALTSLAVLPSERRSGLATRVVAAFEREARRRGFGAIRASTSLDNEFAMGFYRRDGWAVKSLREHENIVTFEKHLDPETPT
jgi:ribosomal protein S18 acetylase RimI-like enzyme